MTTPHDEKPTEAPDQDDEGQVSEASLTAGEQGGADATDKSTGTAPGRADQPGE